MRRRQDQKERGWQGKINEEHIDSGGALLADVTIARGICTEQDEAAGRHGEVEDFSHGMPLLPSAAALGNQLP